MLTNPTREGAPSIGPVPEIWEYFLGCFGEMGGEWICLGVVDLLGIISFFLRVVVGVSWLWAT